MPVRIRLARRGRTHTPHYSVVAADAREKRDGRHIAKLGTYDPTRTPSKVSVKIAQVLDWLMKGAQPTATVRQLLSKCGIMFAWHLAVGVRKGAISQAEAVQKWSTWKKQHGANKKLQSNDWEAVDLQKVLEQIKIVPQKAKKAAPKKATAKKSVTPTKKKITAKAKTVKASEKKAKV